VIYGLSIPEDTNVKSFPAGVLVVGGGPAGLAAAIAARLKGFDVTVVDSAHPPIDKACGEGLMPAGVEALLGLGVRISAADGLPLRGIRFVDGGSSVEARFQSGYGLVLRRTRLHHILAARASELGVRLLWDTHLRSVVPAPCPWVIGADGLHSQVRRAANLDAAIQKSMRFGFRRHYRVAPWTDLVEIHWGSRGQVYVTPVNSDEVGIAVLTRDSSFRLAAAFDEFPNCARGSRAPGSQHPNGARLPSRAVCEMSFADKPC
jgi:flavin-dependent dehydrogenase